MKIVLARELYHSESRYERIIGLTDFFHAMLERDFHVEELPEEVHTSYYVSYYLQQVQNGGFAQFIYNSHWDKAIVSFVERGLRKIHAKRHYLLFQRLKQLVRRLLLQSGTIRERDRILEEPRLRQQIESMNKEFFSLLKIEDLLSLNWSYLGGVESIELVEASEWLAALDELAEEIPDREERRQERMDRRHETEEQHLLRRVATLADRRYEHVEQVLLIEWEGRRDFRWEIKTQQGPCYGIFSREKLMLFDALDDKLLAELSLEEEEEESLSGEFDAMF